MERTWLETIQLLGLDLMVAAIVLALMAAGLVTLAMAARRRFRPRVRRQPRVAPTRPLDVWPSEGWGPSR